MCCHQTLHNFKDLNTGIFTALCENTSRSCCFILNSLLLNSTAVKGIQATFKCGIWIKIDQNIAGSDFKLSIPNILFLINSKRINHKHISI